MEASRPLSLRNVTLAFNTKLHLLHMKEWNVVCSLMDVGVHVNVNLKLINKK